MTGDQHPLDSSRILTERLDIDFALQAAGLGIWEYDLASNRVLWDDRCRALFGLAIDNRMSYEQAFEHVHRDDVARVDQAARWVMNPESNGIFDQTYRTIGVDDGKLRWVRFQGNVRFTPSREVDRFGGVAQEVTQQMLDKQQLVDQQAQLQSIIQQTPAPTLVLRGDEYRIDHINQSMLAFMNRGEEVMGQPLLAIMPELAGQFAWQQVQRVYQEGVDFDLPEMLVPHVREGILRDIYYDVSYRPLREGGRITGMIQVAIDVTERVLARRQVEQSQRQLLALFEQSPVGLATYSADEAFVIQWANPFFGEMVGRLPHALEGKPLLDALPELEGQGFDKILKGVVATRIPFTAPEVAVNILRDGRLTTIYVNLTYQPRQEAEGNVMGILVVATDVTQQVLTRKKVEESEKHLELLRDTVPAMIFYLDAQQRYQSYNKVFKDWFGVAGDEAIGKTVREFLGEAAYQKAQPYLDRVYGGQPERYELLAPERMQENRWLSTTYTPHTNQAGHVIGVVVLSMDITASKQVEGELRQSEESYRQLSAALEQQVQQRTEELAASNEELAVTNEELAANNEEYATLNEELEEANSLLMRSNDNLQRFAYVASHDLQEPLRKIQSFGDLLKSHYADQLGEGADYLTRMQQAAGRMSTLIRDLLAYSRISTQRDTSASVPLQEVIRKVLTDLELVIEETGATIRAAPLPTLPGDALQLSQLFQNLLSNAIKFRRHGTAPVIQINAGLVAADHLPAPVQPSSRALIYHRIEVTDNGIGFEEKYLDRIFQVFQRLHGKSNYVGTGIGLAICEKVATNHGGAITATSQPGQGATFTVYLPV